jgi:hypothetical protein
MSNRVNGTQAAAAATGATAAAVGTSAMAQTASLGPKSTAVPGPGDFAGGRVDFTETGVLGPQNFDTFGCDTFITNPNTPDFVTANAYFERKVFTSEDLKMPDGNKVRYWGFEDPLKAPGVRPFPSPLIRVQEGDLVHVKLGASKGSHTIHHHGMGPTTMNDGVGHVSFEVTGNYIYQFQARRAGTHTYHCHKNTPLHFEMGMVGLMIVDPKPELRAGKMVVPAFAGGPEYHVEKFWVLDDFDPRWHELNHDAGLCGDDVGLNIFQPKYFFITGTPTRPGVLTEAQKIVAKAGEKILIRMVNASYTVLKTTFPKDLTAQVIAVDGHSLGPSADPLQDKPWNAPFTVGGGTPFYMSTGQRHDLLIDTTDKQGRQFNVQFEFQDWITRRVHNSGPKDDPRYLGKSSTYIAIS